MAKKPTVTADETTHQEVFIVQPGPYRGRIMRLVSEASNAALADGWAVEIPGALAPHDTPLPPEGDVAQSYLDWIALIDGAPIPEPPPEPPPAPVVTAVAPPEIEVGTADILVRVTGTGFTPDSVIVFNGGDEPTAVESDVSVTTTVKPSLASGPGTVPVAVRNAGGVSNSVDFTFTAPPETLVGQS